jgi:type III secretory pathway component EscS
MGISSTVFEYWRNSLQHILIRFEDLRDRTRNFYSKIFAVFVVLNLGCYWWALLTAYPGNVFGRKAQEYVLMGFPVALLGAVFDCLSLLVTIYIIKKALHSKNNSSYVFYLSFDLLLAIAASFWVLFVFTISGWVVSLVLAHPESIGSRVWLYEGRVAGAIFNPLSPDNLRNIYFGVVMGASALLPTILHLCLACQSFLRSGAVKLGFLRGDTT